MSTHDRTPQQYHITSTCQLLLQSAAAPLLSVVSLTMVDETALKTPMVIQMKGNTLGGGIQSGRRRSVLASFSTATFGRRAFRTPNVLAAKITTKINGRVTTMCARRYKKKIAGFQGWIIPYR